MVTLWYLTPPSSICSIHSCGRRVQGKRGGFHPGPLDQELGDQRAAGETVRVRVQSDRRGGHTTPLELAWDGDLSQPDPNRKEQEDLSPPKIIRPCTCLSLTSERGQTSSPTLIFLDKYSYFWPEPLTMNKINAPVFILSDCSCCSRKTRVQGPDQQEFLHSRAISQKPCGAKAWPGSKSPTPRPQLPGSPGGEGRAAWGSRQGSHLPAGPGHNAAFPEPKLTFAGKTSAGARRAKSGVTQMRGLPEQLEITISWALLLAQMVRITTA